MRSLKVIYPDKTRVWLGETAAANVLVLAEMLDDLFELQSAYGDPHIALCAPEVQGLMRQIARLLPVLPLRQESFSIEPFLTPLDVMSLTNYFWGKDCAIAQLHAPELAKVDAVVEEYTAETLPIPSSGNPIADILARLSMVDNNTANAMTLMETFDLGTLNALLAQVGELKRDRKERFEEYKEKRLVATINYAREHDVELYTRFIGLGGPDAN